MRIDQAAKRTCSTLLACVVGTACNQTPPPPLDATTNEPRAFGYQVGDLLSRSVTVLAPDGVVLDEASLPQPGVRGNAFELRSVERRSSAAPSGQRHELKFRYQVFLSPPETRTLELPGFTLRFARSPRAQEVRIEAWPVTVSPLVPVEVSPRRGLGELRPDAAPALIDTTFARLRLIGYGTIALLLLGYLSHVYIGLPWWSRARRPFALAWRELRSLTPASSDAQWRNAFQEIHDALNRTCGEVLFEPGIQRFFETQPRYAHLRPDLVRFFEQSRLEHFGHAAQRDSDVGWLVELCRRCRDAERGAA